MWGERQESSFVFIHPSFLSSIVRLWWMTCLKWYLVKKQEKFFLKIWYRSLDLELRTLFALGIQWRDQKKIFLHQKACMIFLINYYFAQKKIIIKRVPNKNFKHSQNKQRALSSLLRHPIIERQHKNYF